MAPGIVPCGTLNSATFIVAPPPVERRHAFCASSAEITVPFSPPSPRSFRVPSHEQIAMSDSSQRSNIEWATITSSRYPTGDGFFIWFDPSQSPSIRDMESPSAPGPLSHGFPRATHRNDQDRGALSQRHGPGSSGDRPVHAALTIPDGAGSITRTPARSFHPASPSDRREGARQSAKLAPDTHTRGTSSTGTTDTIDRCQDPCRPR